MFCKMICPVQLPFLTISIQTSYEWGGKLESKLAYDGQFKPYFEYIADCLKKYSYRIFTMKRHELEFPLKHPKYVVENVDFNP